MKNKNFTLVVGSLVISEIDANIVSVYNELIDRMFLVSSDQGDAFKLALNVLFKHDQLTPDAVERSFDLTDPGINVLKKVG